MKNYFTSVRLPRGRASGEIGECINALGELLVQLRLTINSLDVDNMSESLKKRIESIPRIHEFSEEETIDYTGMKSGDLILIYSPAQSGILKVMDAYIFKEGGTE